MRRRISRAFAAGRWPRRSGGCGGTVARFPQAAGRAAFINLMERMGAGVDAPPEHPLVEAARNSSDPEWSESFYAANETGFTDPIEDLSEP